MWNKRTVVLAFCLLALWSCGRPLDVALSETGVQTVSHDETIHMNNCGGKADSEQTAMRSFSTSLDGTLSISGEGKGTIKGIPVEVEGSLSAKYGQYRATVKTIKLIAPAGTNMEFKLKWLEEEHAGNVIYEKQSGTYSVRIPISVDQVSSQDLGCGGQEAQAEPSLTPIANNILFEENFEDGRVDKLTYISGDWKIISDESKNNLYDMNNTTSSGYWPEIHFGSESWKNYEVKFRMRSFETGLGWAAIGFRRDEINAHDYIVYIDPQGASLNYWAQVSGNHEITYRSHNLERGVWHWIKVDARGTEINVFIDDVAVISTDDSRYSTGGVIMQVGYNSHIQFDDIQVVRLEP